MAEVLKDSRVTWLGKIPESWKIERIGTLYSPRNTKVNDKDYPPLSVTMQGILPQLETVAKTDDHSNRKLVKKGDFAINSRSDRRGSCGISSYDGSVSLINIVLKPNAKMNPAYYNWLFHTSLFADEFYRWGHGIVDDLWTTNWQDMKNIFVTIPPLREQERIADFLDEKCAEIDKLSEDIQKQIDILEEYKKSVITRAVTKGLDANAHMEDSGVDWLGLVNGNWKISKIKHVCDFGPNCKTHSITDDTEISYEPMEFVKNGYFQNNSAKYSEIPKSLTPFEDGDIVIAKVTPCFENGNIAIMNNLHSGIGFGSSELFVLRAKKIKTKFLFYWLQNSHFVGASCSTMTGVGGLKRVSSAFFRNSEICLPSEDTQEEIVSFLDGKIREIDSLIETKNQQINSLLSYKKSVIYEYVTGKKRVI